MKILLCDDDEIFLQELKEKIETVLKNIVQNEAIVIHTFTSIFFLWNYLEEEDKAVDAVFLDIELNDVSGENGIRVADRIQKKYGYIKLIFCTGYLKYAEDIFQVNPLHCIYKPITEEKLESVFKKLVRELEEQKKQYITVKSGKEIYRLMCEDIKYAEIDKNRVNIYIDDECISAVDKLDHIEELLGENFVRCHKSYIVNIRKMRKLEVNKFILLDGTEVAVSRRYKSRVKNAVIGLFD